MNADTDTPNTLVPWPNDGVNAIDPRGEEMQCRLSVEDGNGIRNAVAAYIRSQTARDKHSKDDLELAERCLGPPHMVGQGEASLPKVGQFFVYAGDTECVRLQNTVGITDQARWGLSVDLGRKDADWEVTGFSRWQAWRKRD